jgi:uncharacterized membrane protein YqjE
MREYPSPNSFRSDTHCADDSAYRCSHLIAANVNTLTHFRRGVLQSFPVMFDIFEMLSLIVVVAVGINPAKRILKAVLQLANFLNMSLIDTLNQRISDRLVDSLGY